MSFLTRLPRGLYSKNAFDAFDGASQSFNLGTAHAMAWACQLAYETNDPAKIKGICPSWGIADPTGGILSEEVVTALPKARTQAIVCDRGDATIITFAGTDPPELADWISNFDIGITRGGAAHGFAVAAQAVESKIDKLLANDPADKPIFVTGHSLGGALAVLSAAAIEAARPNRVRAVYTFGMPRPGRADFATTYNPTLGERTYRLVHGDDVVPTVAPSVLGFQHVGRHLHCARQGKFQAHALAPLMPPSDEPQFKKGISTQLKDLLHGSLSNIMPTQARAALAGLLLGTGGGGLRTDAGGVIIELLPPPLRDHMPDRYIAAT
jgi:hypothetical protein